MKVLKKVIIITLALAFLIVVPVLGSYLGINLSNSLDFRFYYHTALGTYTIKQGDYLSLSFPQNELYPTGTLIVKQVACIEGQYLETLAIDNKIKFYCDKKFIAELTVFTRPNGEKLKTFDYNGVIPNGSYFMLGSDIDSYDSKYWGFATKKDIKRLVHPIVFNNPFISTAYAEDFYKEKNTGWYKYAIEQKEEEKDNQESKKVSVLVRPTIDWENVSSMPVKEFRQLFEDVQDYAMTYRNLDTFSDYAKLQDVLIARSVEFSDVGQLYKQLNLNNTDEGWFPTTGFGQEVYQAETTNMKMQYLFNSSADYGVLYFYRPDCAFCEKEAPLIRYIEDTTRLPVKWINIYEEQAAALRFNIQTVPAVVLVEKKSARWMPISVGLVVADEIINRLFKTIRYLKGETNETNYDMLIRPDVYINGNSTASASKGLAR